MKNRFESFSPSVHLGHNTPNEHVCWLPIHKVVVPPHVRSFLCMVFLSITYRDFIRRSVIRYTSGVHGHLELNYREESVIRYPLPPLHQVSKR